MAAVDVIWIRWDLRLIDHPALIAGSEHPAVLLFTADGVDCAGLGEASRVYLHHALQSFQADLAEQYQARLLIYPSLRDGLDAIRRVATIRRVLWNRSYEPAGMLRDQNVVQQLEKQGI